jgi:hypothetical protein
MSCLRQGGVKRRGEFLLKKAEIGPGFAAYNG